MHWSRRGVPRVDGRVIPWIRVLAKFINDLRGDEHRPSGLPCVAHPSSIGYERRALSRSGAG